MPNGYETYHAVLLTARADMQESVAGLDATGLKRELAFAYAATDENDAESLRWFACLIARRIEDLTA